MGKTHETDLLPDQKGTEVDTSCNLPTTYILLAEGMVNMTPLYIALQMHPLFIYKKIVTAERHESI